MPRLHWHRVRPRDRPWVAAWAIVLLAVSGASGAAARSGDAWTDCQDRVIAQLEAAGRRDHGDVGAYTGTTGAGAQETVIERCGYHPETVDRAFCEELYQQVYLACREDGFEGLSMAASSWVSLFRPGSPLVERLRRVCAQSAPVSQGAFDRLVCGK